MTVLWTAQPGQTRWYRGVAIADGTSSKLQLDRSIVVRNGVIAGFFGLDDVPDPVRRDSAVEVVDCSGATAVPGLVDAHSHLTLPGGAHWLLRAADPTAQLLKVAEQNAANLIRSGVRWIRDVGSPVRSDSGDGRTRALSLSARDSWRNRADVPHIRAAGTWLTAQGVLPDGLAGEASSADELVDLAIRQLDDGAELVKLYLDGRDPERPPWSAAEVDRVVRAVHQRGASVAAHATREANVRTAVQAGVDTLEHGTELTPAVAAQMARQGTTLVTTLSVYQSFQTFGYTTSMPRFTDRRTQRELYERALTSVGHARRAGVRIAAGTDFGGGSVRSGHIAWELASLAEAGMPAWEALRAATLGGGSVLGDPHAGRIVVGGPADFVLVHGDPTTDAAAMWRIWHVVLSGRTADDLTFHRDAATASPARAVGVATQPAE